MRRKLLFCTWVLLWLIIGLVAVEFLSRQLLTPWHKEIGHRNMQPYFMTGGYFENRAVEGIADDVAIGRSGPEEYGYVKSGDIYVFEFEKEVFSIADRGEFLFQDRVELANDSGRRDIKRIFLIGGSAAYGIGASSREKRWYMHLERSLIAALKQEVRLIPAAHPGYGSTQERLILNLFVLPRRPDAVIIFDGFNDAALPSIFGNRPGDPYDQAVLYADFYSPIFDLKKWIAKYSHLYRHLMHRSMARTLAKNEKRILENPRLLNNYARSTAAVYIDNVRHMLRRCRDQGVPCKAFLQPVRDVTWRSQGIEKQLDPFTLAAYDRIRKQIPDIVPDNPIIDLTSVFDGPRQDEWYRDSVHFKDLGHEAIAEAMHPIVIDMLREKSSVRTPNRIH